MLKRSKEMTILFALFVAALAAPGAQHRQWAKNARRLNRPDLAQAHEQLA